jgi:hypothetical protein
MLLLFPTLLSVIHNSVDNGKAQVNRGGSFRNSRGIIGSSRGITPSETIDP